MKVWEEIIKSEILIWPFSKKLNIFMVFVCSISVLVYYYYSRSLNLERGWTWSREWFNYHFVFLYRKSLHLSACTSFLSSVHLFHSDCLAFIDKSMFMIAFRYVLKLLNSNQLFVILCFSQPCYASLKWCNHEHFVCDSIFIYFVHNIIECCTSFCDLVCNGVCSLISSICLITGLAYKAFWSFWIVIFNFVIERINIIYLHNKLPRHNTRCT